VGGFWGVAGGYLTVSGGGNDIGTLTPIGVKVIETGAGTS